jgi:hypothetical protein
MAYSDFTFEKLETDLQVIINEANLYSSVKSLILTPCATF